MRNILLFLALGLSPLVHAQELLKINIAGIAPQTSEKLNANNDRISWYTSGNSSTLATNLVVSLKNVGQNLGDKGRMGVKADPAPNGQYSFQTTVEVKAKRIDKTQPVEYEVVLETILGNEVFAKGVLQPNEFEKPIVLDGYMWRASNEKIAPEKKLCLAFAAYIEDSEMRARFSELEGEMKFDRSAFAVFLKQEGMQEWMAYTESIQGSLSNGNALAMTSPLPNWLNTAKPLQVRFSVKTEKGNFIWGEYAVQPNEYRKEFRAKHYTTVPFDANAKAGAAGTPSAPAQTTTTPQDSPTKATTTQDTPPSAPIKSESKPEKPDYKTLVAEADKYFQEGQYQAARDKYTEASAFMPNESYPKDRIAECNTGINSVKPLKDAGLKNKMK
jgi:hypothetical protein